jgi:hypothetical protein
VPLKNSTSQEKVKKAGANAGFSVTATIEDGEDDDDDDSDEDYDGCEETSLEVSHFYDDDTFRPIATVRYQRHGLTFYLSR